MAVRIPKTRGMLRRSAASWLARLQSGRDPDIERKFQRWHNADPRNAAAFDRVRRTYDQAGLLINSPSIAAPECEPAVRKPQWSRPALAAAVALLVMVPAAVLLFCGGVLVGGTNVVMLITNDGEIKQINLADGSKLILDTATRVDVAIGRTGRRATLRYGRARFEIARANVPFLIETTSSTITANQGVMDVEQIGSQDFIQLLAGAADVRGSNRARGSPVALAAGNSVTVKDSGAEQTGVIARSSDWTRGMLQFDGTPLVDAVELANRYSKQHIMLMGDFASLRVTGAFRAGDMAGLAKALAAAFDLSFRQLPDGTQVLSRSTSPALQNKKGG